MSDLYDYDELAMTFWNVSQEHIGSCDTDFFDYPVPPNKVRIHLGLLNPQENLEYFLDSSLRYWNDNWSSIFHIQETSIAEKDCCFLYAESGHQSPWGEPIKFLTRDQNDSDFAIAYFRGVYWGVCECVCHFHFPIQYVIDESIFLAGNNRTWSTSVEKKKVNWAKNGF